MICGKKIFTKREAEAILKKKGRSRKRGKKEKRMYYCEPCNGWHLTSQEEEPKLVQNNISKKFKKQWEKLLKNK